MKKPVVYVSSGAFDVGSVNELLGVARDWGIDRIELSSGLPPDAAALDVARAGARDDFTFLVHNYFPAPLEPFVLNLASGDADSLRASRSHCRSSIDLCAELACPFYSVHAGFAARLRPEHLGRKLPPELAMPRDEAETIFEDSIGELVAYGERRGVRLLVENNVVAPFNLQQGHNELLLLAEPSELVDFASRIGSPTFGYLIDVAHAYVSATTLGFDPVPFLKQVKPWTAALHLSANDGTRDTNDPFGPDAWFIPHLEHFKDVIMVVEAYRLRREQLEACLKAIENAVDEI
ncbi:MAG: sugar phosphate isomerase/epimerase [Chromatiaceae bacterium]|nr:sugar phosphate isomerase/epimerase [Chromatiaceae bacterium]